jgi:hypothetical protein
MPDLRKDGLCQAIGACHGYDVLGTQDVKI